MKLTYSKANSKLQKLADSLGIKLSHIVSFDLPAGKTCPGALDCKAWSVKVDNKASIARDDKAQFTCYAASAEIMYPEVYNMRHNNLKSVKELLSISSYTLAQALLDALPKTAKVVRLHTSGDFFHKDYLQAWVSVANARPNVRFYAYTKSLPLFANVTLPDNFKVTASLGGKFDEQANIMPQTAKVVFSMQEAKELGLGVSVDDTEAALGTGNFALLIHGVQKAGTKASQALQAIKKHNKSLQIVEQ